jgi:hypothetical protein
MIPGQYVIYEVIIYALKEWNGYIDFRIDTPEGRRVAHHRCEIYPAPTTKER